MPDSLKTTDAATLKFNFQIRNITRQRIEENFHSFGFSLSEEDMALITAFDTGKPIVGDFDNPEFVRELCK